MTRTHVRTVLTTILVMLLLAAGVAGGYLAGTARTPAQVAARAVPPTPTVLTAPVAAGPLLERAQLPARVAPGSTHTVPLPRPSGAPVVTKVGVRPGAEVTAGTLLCDISGVPVVVLPGEFPAYRDLQAGARGPDVRQLQTGLREAGVNVGVTGTLDPATMTALTAFAQRLGYQAADLLKAQAFVYLPRLPATLDGALPEPGPLAEGASATLAWGDPVATAPIPADLEEKIRSTKPAPTFSVMGRKDTTVRLRNVGPSRSTTSSGQAQTGTPADGPSDEASESASTGAQGDQPADGGSGAGGAKDQTGQAGQMVATFTIDPVPADTDEMVIDVVFGRSGRGAVVVPIAALFTDGVGRDIVTVDRGDKGRQDVLVTISLVVEGQAAVTPTQGTLAADDLVVIGSKAT